jgi:hypothetical protein
MEYFALLQCPTVMGGAMNRKSILAAVLLLSATAGQAGDRVEVAFVHPEKFTDAGRYWGSDASRQHNLTELARHIERRAARLLPQDRRLAVSITEVDLAGGFEPWRRNLGDVRIVRDVYPPRIDLSFRLTAADGSVLKQGERRLRDLAFQTGATVYRDDPLRYEKALIDGWLERELRQG